jgi:hypothetical protein
MKKIYEKPSMKEHKLKHQISLLAASVDRYGMNTKLVLPSTYDGNGDDDGNDGNDEYVVTEAW